MSRGAIQAIPSVRGIQRATTHKRKNTTKDVQEEDEEYGDEAIEEEDDEVFEYDDENWTELGFSSTNPFATLKKIVGNTTTLPDSISRPRGLLTSGPASIYRDISDICL